MSRRPGAPSAVDDTADAPTHAEPIVTAAGVSKVYRPRKHESHTALQSVDVRVAAGEFVSVVGPSGCGKTTLLKVMAGLVAATTGEVRFHGSGPDGGEALHGMVFQQPALLPWRTVLDNVLLPIAVLRRPRKAYLGRATALLEMVDLGDSLDRYPNELSGGMQQRVAIARALVHDPELLYMDEPFGALDAMTREQMNLALQDIHMSQRKAVVFVTHSIQEAALLSDRVLVMSGAPGRIVGEIPVDIPRPRGIDVLLTREFREIEARIRASLEAGKHASAVGGDATATGEDAR